MTERELFCTFYDEFNIVKSEYDRTRFQETNEAGMVYLKRMLYLSVTSAALYNKLNGLFRSKFKSEYSESLNNIVFALEEYVSIFPESVTNLYSAVLFTVSLLSPIARSEIAELIHYDTDLDELFLDQLSYTIIFECAILNFEFDNDEWGLLIVAALFDVVSNVYGEESVQYETLICEIIIHAYGYCPEYVVDLYHRYFKLQDFQLSNELADAYWFVACIYEKEKIPKASMEAFYSCYQVRKELYGEDDWYTQFAKRNYALKSIVLKSRMDDEERSIFEHFVDCCINGLFDSVTDKEVLLQIEGESLYALCHSKLSSRDLNYNEIMKYREIAYLFHDDPLKEYIDLRAAENFLGLYYIMIGDYVKAEYSLYNALEIDCSEIKLISSDEIRANLILLYCSTNELDKAQSVLEDMEIDDCRFTNLDRNLSNLVWGDLLLLYISNIDESDDYALDIASNILQEAQTVFLENSVDTISDENFRMILASFNAIIFFHCKGRDVSEYYNLLHKYESLVGAKEYSVELTCTLDLLLYLATGHERYLIELRKCIDDGRVGAEFSLSIYSGMIAYYVKQERENEAKILTVFVDLKLNMLLNQYCQYINDMRLSELCEQMIYPINCAYYVRRKEKDLESAYDLIINYKSVVSLVGRYRNRIINDYNLDSSLIHEINAIQDKLCVRYYNSIFNNLNDGTMDLERQLLDLEYKFSCAYPESRISMRISMEEVINALPDNSAVIEYYPYFSIENESEDADVFLDVYTVVKQDGTVDIGRRTINNAIEVLEQVRLYSDMFYKESTRRLSENESEYKEKEKRVLYNVLIAPEISKLPEIEKLYIAPTQELSNLSFELLTDESRTLIGEKYSVVYIECIRDFIFSMKKDFGEGALLIGNPKHYVERRQNGRRGCNEVDDLPFSEVEVKLAAHYCKSKYYIGDEATKSLLDLGKKCRIIHIASHGNFDTKNETNALFSARIMLSNKLSTSEEGIDRTDGMVTADEISRLDLQNTELVVLTTCLGGCNSADLIREHQGLIGAFSAAGVKYVISNLWYTYDAATSLLMNVFYYYYKIFNDSPDTALRKAKQYLRNITVREIKQTKIVDYVLQNDSLDSPYKKSLELMLSRPDSFRPYKKEIYWGGFVCYQCN